MSQASIKPLAAYFSHSWNARDILVNVKIWERLAGDCLLLIDQPEEARGGKPPYFISRLETLMRRSDVFVCCLPALPSERESSREPTSYGDWRYAECSPFILFELRLAERADLPRFVLYDRDSRFQPPAHPSPHVRYVARRFGELRAMLAGGGEDVHLADELEQWLSWVQRHHRHAPSLESQRAAFLLAETGDNIAFRDMVVEAVDEGGFDRPTTLLSVFQTDAELYQALRSLGLLVVDVSRPELLPLYHAAHSLMVPTIRVHTAVVAEHNPTDDFLPTLLRGHPGGYQRDLVLPNTSDATFEAIVQRTRAITRSAQPVIGFDKGRSLLHERTYPKHLVFISHEEKLNDRILINEIVRQCRDQGITCWEYAVENRSGDVWRVNMDNALAKTTHMVALLSSGYEQSPGCCDEWKFAMDRRPSILLLPFLTRGRTRPAVGLRGEEIAHETLPDSRSHLENAAIVVSRIRESLLASKT